MAIVKGLTRIVEEAIKSEISTDADVLAAVGTNFYYNRYYPRYNFPLIIVHTAGQNLLRKTHGGADGHDNRTMGFSITIATKSTDDDKAFTECKDLADAVFNTLRFTSLEDQISPPLFFPLEIEQYDPAPSRDGGEYVWASEMTVRCTYRNARK